MKILIADDDAVARRMLEVVVQSWGFETVTARDGEEALQLMQGDAPPALAIVDWMMPKLDGVALCHRKQAASESAPYVYLIMLTARSGTSEMVAAMAAGADDYVVKPYDVNELQARVRAGLRIQHLQETLRLLATRDALTGLWNRRSVLDQLDRELERRQRRPEPFTLMMIDLDWFKTINDRYGHPAGDDALIVAAKRLQAGLRSVDTLGRLGGEEFIAVLPGMDAAAARVTAERLRERLSGSPVPTCSGPIALTTSIGIASFDASTPVGARDAIAAADRALYRAKALGRNRVEISTPDPEPLAGRCAPEPAPLAG